MKKSSYVKKLIILGLATIGTAHSSFADLPVVVSCTSNDSYIKNVCIYQMKDQYEDRYIMTWGISGSDCKATQADKFYSRDFVDHAIHINEHKIILEEGPFSLCVDARHTKFTFDRVTQKATLKMCNPPVGGIWGPQGDDEPNGKFHADLQCTVVDSSGL